MKRWRWPWRRRVQCAAMTDGVRCRLEAGHIERGEGQHRWWWESEGQTESKAWGPNFPRAQEESMFYRAPLDDRGPVEVKGPDPDQWPTRE